jgi:2-dehydro-3-deoxygalactonokinase
MANYITVDCGTTNTRVGLMCNGALAKSVSFHLGARAHAADPQEYRVALTEAIRTLEKGAEPEAILVSGMLTSELGICPIPHLVAPVGLQNLHNGMQKMCIPDICDKPFYFIPGVRTAGEDALDRDMMRGEETELMGLMTGNEGACVFVLPGSHSKFISVDDKGRIASIVTLLTGEMAAALSGHTILSDSVSLEDGLDTDALRAGYRCCRERGINEAIFKVRVLDKQLSKKAPERYGFFLGCVLCGEVERLLSYPATTIVIAGQRQLKRAMCILLADSGRRVIEVPDDVAATAAFRGMVKIFECEGEQ